MTVTGDTLLSQQLHRLALDQFLHEGPPLSGEIAAGLVQIFPLFFNALLEFSNAAIGLIQVLALLLNAFQSFQAFLGFLLRC